MNLKEFVDAAVSQDLSWIESQLEECSGSLLSLICYRLGQESYRVLSEGVKNDTLPEGELEYDKIAEKIELIVSHLNRKEFGDENPSRFEGSDSPVMDWLKNRKL